MKRFGFLYEQIVSVENCKAAIINASAKKRRRKSVQDITSNLDYYASDLSKRLIALDFLTPYRTRMIRDGLSGKQRELQIPSFYPDQCAHHAIVQILQPIFMKSSYHWSCANIPNRGIDRACKGVERATVRDTKHAKYCVKMDIHKFYPSIPHDKLKARLREKIKDEKALQIIDKVIDSHSPGIPIGNYTSPWLAEFYLQPLDWFIKQTLGVRHYIRYADDLVLIGSNKRELRKAMNAIMEFIKDLGMEVKHDYQLFRIQRNCKEKKQRKGRKIDFVGRCFGIGFTTIRKRRALALMRQSRYIQKLQRTNRPVPYRVASGFLSRCACFKHTNSQAMKKKYYDTVNIKKLKEVISNESKRKCLAQCA
ncbi:MAG: reverse transcriptase/maturase family protein [Oscillospiraceae bacterium]|nr:reverse transcriptase/maturase family protein [Oscillospiraceae bacterium]